MNMSNAKPRSAGMGTFIFIWIGQAISMLGSGMTQFALTIWAYQIDWFGDRPGACRLLLLCADRASPARWPVPWSIAGTASW